MSNHSKQIITSIWERNYTFHLMPNPPTPPLFLWSRLTSRPEPFRASSDADPPYVKKIISFLEKKEPWRTCFAQLLVVSVLLKRQIMLSHLGRDGVHNNETKSDRRAQRVSALRWNLARQAVRAETERRHRWTAACAHVLRIQHMVPQMCRTFQRTYEPFHQKDT